MYVIAEPSLGAARPDIALVVASQTFIDHYRQAGLRIPTLTAARLLEPESPPGQAGISEQHARSLLRTLGESGWTPRRAEFIAARLRRVTGIEVKMKDWRQAVRQVSRFRRHFDESLVIMPERTFSEETYAVMKSYGAGLLTLTQGGMEWKVAPIASRAPVSSRLWVGELLLRGLENGTAYRLSSSRNSRIARL